MRKQDMATRDGPLRGHGHYNADGSQWWDDTPVLPLQLPIEHVGPDDAYGAQGR